MKHYTIPIFIPELACPFQCIYCNQRIISGKSSIPTSEQIKENIETHLVTFKEGAYIELGFFGGNFTGIPEEEQIRLLSLVQPYISSEKIKSIRISTRPDYISSKVVRILKRYNVKTIELGIQSMDDTVLRLSKRGYTSKIAEDACKLIKESGFELGMQMMIGLPGDTKEKSLKTTLKIIELGAECTRIYPTIVVQNTELAQMYLKNEYQPLTLEQAVDWAKEPLLHFEKNNVNILRVGLHPTEGFINGTDFLAGPFHVSFKELVISEVWKNNLLAVCSKKFNIENSISIYVSEKEINHAIGYQSKNKVLLSQYFKKVIFKTDLQISNRNFKIEFE